MSIYNTESKTHKTSSIKIIFGVFCLIFISGCARYQYVFVESDLSQNDNKEYFTENDTLLIKYTFKGENFPITLTIYNKLNQPLYIDWSRSVVVINNIQIEGAFYHNGLTDFIAPLSYVIATSNNLKDQFIEYNPGDSTTYIAISGGGSRVKKYSYNERTTPLFFRNILAVSPNEDYSLPTFYDYSFWVSDIVQSGSAPSELTYSPANQFFIRKITKAGNFLGGIATLTALVILQAITGGE